MMKKILVALTAVFILNVSCGIETLLILLPAISATWCDANEPCHKYEFRPGQEASDDQDLGNIGGLEYWTKQGQTFKLKDRTTAGHNFIIGTYSGYNVEFAVHYRLDTKYEEYYVGSVEIQDDGTKMMYIENLTTKEKLTLATDATVCNCQN